MVGYLKVDKLSYLDWYKSDCFKNLQNLWPSIAHYNSSDIGISDAYNDLACRITYYDTFTDSKIKFLKEDFDRKSQEYVDMLSDTLDYMGRYNMKFTVLKEYHNMFHAKLGGKHFLFLKVADGLDMMYLKSYSKENIMSDDYMESSIEGITSDLVPAGYTLSSAEGEMDGVLKKEAEYNDRAERIKSGTSHELIDLKKKIDELNAELEEQQKELMEQLNLAREELESKKIELTRKIEILETKIYAIRCFTGEVINFSQLRSGDRLPTESPLVINQKVRYLDEEMGRLCALYDFDFSDIKYFEEFLATNDDALEVFCPSPKSISLVRITRDNQHYRSVINGMINKAEVKYESILKSFQTYHGACIGILIRDGGYLYCGWTDDDHISIPDDLFYTDKVRVDSEEDADSIRSSTKEEILSRYFIFNILKGCLSPMSSSFNMINLPLDVDIMKQPNPYVILSSADGWIDSNKYKDFATTLKICNDATKVGDHVISAMSIYNYNSDTYSNERGRGDRNITRGVHLTDNSLEVINLIDNNESTAEYNSDDIVTRRSHEYDKEQRCYKTVDKQVKFHKRHIFDNNTTRRDMLDRFKSDCDHDNIEFDEKNITWNMQDNYYISVLKDDSDYTYYDNDYKRRERESRVNLLVYSDEFINIECMNSNWIEYYIESKKTKNVSIGGKQVNYSYLIMYLKNALNYIREREQHEMALMMEAGFRDFDKVDWLDELSRYKLETGRHELKPRWAKQLAAKLNELVKTS